MNEELKQRKAQITASMIQNDEDYVYYYNFLKMLTMSMFEWVNIPDTIDERYLELTLFQRGNVLWFKDYDLDINLCLQSVNAGVFNVYNIPCRSHVFTASGYYADRTPKDSVIIWNNSLRLSNELPIRRFARKLSVISRTIDVNVQAQKTPYFITCDENQRLTLKNVFAQMQGNEPVIYGGKILSLESIKVNQTLAPIVFDKLQLQLHSVMNEVFSFLGINNANQDKKERLVEDEVSANDEQIEQARYIMLQARKEACKKINQMFGLNIDVRFRNCKDNKTKEWGVDNE